jgi:protein SCO1/2
MKILLNFFGSLPLFFSLVFICAFVKVPKTYSIREIPRELKDIGIDEHLGDHLDLDLVFVDEKGQKKKLSSYITGDKPTVLILGYYECPRLCGLVFNGFSLTAKSLQWSIGDEYNVITVSINPKETFDLAKQKQANYVKNYGRRSAQHGWHFLTGDQENITKLAEQVGYRYKYDKKIKQYAHAAALILLTPKGKISRYLYGIDFKHNDLKLGLLEASEGKTGTVAEQLLLFCFQYDPDAQGYSFTIIRLMKFFGLLTLIVLGAYLLIFWKRQIFKPTQSHST